MKKVMISATFLLFGLGVGNLVSAPKMMGQEHYPVTSSLASETQDQTTDDEAAGKSLWEKFQTKQVTCADLKDADFDVLGDYFMGQMMGSSHAAMNQMMTNQLGDVGETQMHIVMGKRLSGCDPSAAYSSSLQGFFPMMGMMWGGYPGGYGNLTSGCGAYEPFSRWGNFAMMGRGYGWIAWVRLGLIMLWWVFVALVVAFVVRWLVRRFSSDHGSHRALNVLKERYAKGEIDREQFDAMKKTLGE